jgi:hypothetical protein
VAKAHQTMALTFRKVRRSPRIFLAYRRSDTQWITGRIFDRLRDHFGRSAIFMDIEATPPGVDFREHIARMLKKCNVLVAVIGPHWDQPRLFDAEDWVRAEIETALSSRIRIIPVLIDGARLPAVSSIPESIREFAYRNASNIDSGRNFDVDINRLIDAIDPQAARQRLGPRYQVAYRLAAVIATVVTITAAAALYVLGKFDLESPESKLAKRESAVRACNAEFTFECATVGGASGSEEALAGLRRCKRDDIIVLSDDPALQWKDVWTTSVYSFAPGGGGPGGGLDDDLLKVGGWGDWYFSLIQFKLPQLRSRPKFAAIALYSKQSEGTSVALALDRIIQKWDFPKGDRLWWKDRPGHRAVTTDSLPAPHKEQWYLIDLTALVQEWLDGKTDNFGIQIRPMHNFGSFVFFVSSDAADKSKIPRLVFCP